MSTTSLHHKVRHAQDFCLTLAQFTANTSRYLYFNTTLLFQSGNHILDLSLRIGGIRSLQLLKSVPFETATVTVQCEPFGRFYFFNVNIVHINQLKFVNCSNNIVRFVQNLSVVDSYFIGQDNSSSALDLHKSVAVIRQTSFRSYRNGKLKELVRWKQKTDAYQSEVSFSRSGGALIVLQSDIVIVECTFKDNGAEVGGAIFFELSRVKIENSTFAENYVTSHRNDGSCRGGALYFQIGCVVTIYNCSFTNNTGLLKTVHIHSIGGGAITFVGRQYGFHPGFPIEYYSMNPQMVITLSLCDFSHNKAEIGGAIVAIGINILNISRTNFTNNTDGAVFSIVYDFRHTVYISSCRFSYNWAKMFGGAVVVECMEGQVHLVSIYKSTFSANTAGKYGGAVLINANAPKSQ